MKKKKVLTTAIVTTLALAGGIVFATSNINVSSSILSADSEEPYSFTLTKDTTPFAYDSAQDSYYTDIDLGGGYLRRVRADCGRLDSNYLIVVEEDKGIYTGIESVGDGILDNNEIVGLQKIEMKFHLTDSELAGYTGFDFGFDIYEYDDTMYMINYDSVSVTIGSSTELTLSYNFHKEDCRHFFIQNSFGNSLDLRVSSLTVTYTCA